MNNIAGLKIQWLDLWSIWLLYMMFLSSWIPYTMSLKPTIKIGAIIPSNSFTIRVLNSTIISTIRQTISSKEFTESTLLKNYDISKIPVIMPMPSPVVPEATLNFLCEEMVNEQVNTLIYMRDADRKGETTGTTNYVMNLANTIGIPVIAWVGDSSGLAQTSRESIVVQMTPSVTHQCLAMVDLLKLYNWKFFTIVTGLLSGKDHFIDTLRNLADKSESLEVLSVIKIKSANETSIKKHLTKINETQSRIILLYASNSESKGILKAAQEMGLLGKEFVWIASRSIVRGSRKNLPQGIFGVRFYFDGLDLEEVEISALKQISKIWLKAMKNMVDDAEQSNKRISMVPDFRCNDTSLFWKEGQNLYEHMINISIEGDKGDKIEFNEDGTMKFTSLAITNLRKDGKWKEIGMWDAMEGITIDDIFWPEDAPTPPEGRPSRYQLKVVTLKESPYVIYSKPDPNTGECPVQSSPCRIAPLDKIKDYPNATSNPDFYACCSGFCIDLLTMLSDRMGFNFELFQVDDGIWGAPNKKTGEWRGIIKSIMDNEADMAMTSLKITPERNEVVDFSVPFLETGITIIVAVRDGVITPTAFLKPFDLVSWIFILLMCIQVLAVAVFLFEWMSPSGFNFHRHPPREPYDYPSWCLILVFSVHACGAAIFIFEWLSPSGLDRGTKPIREHKFSLFRSFWLIWAMLFGAAVNVDNPKGVSSRFLANIWALFAVVFTASYTANLATFMITKDTYDKLSGIDDYRLFNGHKLKPPYKFGTIPEGSTSTNIQNNFPKMWDYMKNYNRESVDFGVNAVKDGDINAFIYDATVLEYKASHDDECKLKTVGNWYAMTGYGVAVPKGSKWISQINKVITKLQYEGHLERLEKFWLTGACKYKSDEEAQSKSIPLGILNFTSAFILLASGMLLGGLLLLLEHVYFKCFRAKLRKLDKCGCCGLISLSMGKSLTFEQSVREAIELQKHHKCKNPVCETQTWKLKHELDLALLKAERLDRNLSDNGIIPAEQQRAVWRKPRPGLQDYQQRPPSIGWKNDVPPNYSNKAPSPITYRNYSNNRGATSSSSPSTSGTLDSTLRSRGGGLSTGSGYGGPPTTPPSAWQGESMLCEPPYQPHSVAGFQPTQVYPTLPYPSSTTNSNGHHPNYIPPQPLYDQIHTPPSKRGGMQGTRPQDQHQTQAKSQPNKKGSKSLPSSPVKRPRTPQHSREEWIDGPGCQQEEHPQGEENNPHMTRTISFPENPRRRTRMYQGNMYTQVNRSEPHIFEKETVL